MKIRSTLKYQLNDYKYVILGMYGFVYLFVAFLYPHDKVKNSAVGGMELISLLAVFVLGISSFKPYFKFFSVNGVSRRTLFSSAAAALAIVSVFNSFIDTLNTLLFSSFTNYQSMFMQFYYRIDLKIVHADTQDVYCGLHYTFPMLAQQFLWSVFAYFWIAMIGLFITVLFYRMSKLMKFAVGIGVPVLCLIILPAFDKYCWDNRLSNILAKIFNFIWGYSNGYNPYIGMASMSIFTVAAAALIWLLVRQAGVKQ